MTVLSYKAMCQPHNIPATGAQGTGGGSAHTRTEKWIFWGQNISDFSGIYVLSSGKIAQPPN